MLHLKAHDTALLAAELHTNEMDGQSLGPVFVGIAAILDLLQGPALGRQFHHLELEQEHLAIEAHRHVQATLAGGILQGDIPSGGTVFLQSALLS